MKAILATNRKIVDVEYIGKTSKTIFYKDMYDGYAYNDVFWLLL